MDVVREELDSNGPFQETLSAWLARTGTSQAELSRRSGVPQGVISRWLSRTPTRPTTPNLAKLAPVIGLPYEDLMRMCGYLPGVTAVRAVVDARRQAKRDELDRWLAAVGPEYEDYFWADAKAHLSSTAQLIEQLRTAVSTDGDGVVSRVVSGRGTRGRPRRTPGSGGLTAS